MNSKIKSVILTVVLLHLLPNLISKTQAQNVSNHSIAAFYVFGDSYVDPGNNDYIATFAKSNFPPYGVDYLNRQATGRFSNGKLIADFLASYLGFENYVAYLDPNFSIQAKPSVGFASAGTGFDNRTAALLNVIPMSTQLEFFNEYKATLVRTIGEEKADNQTKNAVFVVNCAVNDFVFYYGPGNIVFPVGLTIEQYEEFLLQQVQEFIEGLEGLGARRIAVSGVPLFGCWPFVITLYSANPQNAQVLRRCNETLNAIGNAYNMKVQQLLKQIQNKSANTGLKLAYLDTYTSMHDIQQNPANYGFDVINKGCCGTGLVELGPFCNSGSSLCANRSKYEFFDSVHLTEAASSIVAHANIDAINSIITKEAATRFSLRGLQCCSHQ